jgi:N-acetylglucosamine-6-sulfatase
MSSRRGLLTLVLVLVVLAALSVRLVSAQVDRRSVAGRPNIVFVLTDDLTWNLVQYMPHVLQLQRRGVTFSRYIVTDSLCCPSRSSIFTGLFPHDTGVLTNSGYDHGGYLAFLAHDDEAKTFAVAVHGRGYMTSMMGKYLNDYNPAVLSVPRGWSDWHVAGNGYPEFNYDLNANGHLVHFGGRTSPTNYLTDVLATRATKFVAEAAKAHKPFLLEVATFAPHAPYTPAPRNAQDFPGLTEPRDPSFNTNNVNPPSWLGKRAPLAPAVVRRIDLAYRKRAQAVEAVDQLIGEVENVLGSLGLAKNTYIVFSSDNGYHMGQHRLLPGKMTAFDTDIRVPLIVTGPGVPHDRTIPQLVENVDLYPTFAQLTGGTPAPSIDGHSLVPLLHGQRVRRWRTAALIEHHGPATPTGNPDYEHGGLGGNPITYDAVRLGDAVIAGQLVHNAVYVEYANGEREYYNINTDPNERRNTYNRLRPQQRNQLHAITAALTGCHGLAVCWAAALPR